jgi:uroporphyrinogen-III synthase
MSSIILTRSADDNRAIAPLFEARGFVVLSAPMIELRPLPKDMCGLRSVRRLAGGEEVLITSAYAADLWLDLRETDFHEHPPAGYYVVGEKSAALLRDGDPETPILAVADSGDELLGHPSLAVDAGGRRLLYPCSAGRRDALVDGLAARGFDVIELPLYAPVRPADARDSLLAALASATASATSPLAIAFFSPSAVESFFSLGVPLPSDAIIAAIGPTTADALAARGVGATVVAGSPRAEAMAEVLAGIMGSGS